MKLVIGLLALAGVLCEWIDLGLPALRLFSFWVLLIVAIYYLTVALKAIIHKSSYSTESFSIVLEGALLIAGILMLTGFLLVRVTNNFACSLGSDITIRITEEGYSAGYCTQWAGPGSPYVAEEGGASLSFVWPVIIYLLIPIMIIADWILFTKKGRWRSVDPLYWLALPVIYVALIFLTAGSVRDWAYPYLFLDYSRVGVRETALWICFSGAMIFFVGYVLLIIDYTASGKLGQHIVLPHVRTVVIEEEGESDERNDILADESQGEKKVLTPEKKSKKRVSPAKNNNAAEKNKSPKTKNTKAAAAKTSDDDSKSQVDTGEKAKKGPTKSKTSSQQSTKAKSETATPKNVKKADDGVEKSMKAPSKSAAKSKASKSDAPKPKDEFAIPKVIKRQSGDKTAQTPKITRSPKIEKFVTFKMPEQSADQTAKVSKADDSKQNQDQNQEKNLSKKTENEKDNRAKNKDDATKTTKEASTGSETS